MRNFVKKLFYLMPVWAQRFILELYENYHAAKIRNLFKIDNNSERSRLQNSKPRILFYHISGLSFGGTEKFLQILAKHLNYEKYDIYFMYSSKPRSAQTARSYGSIRIDGRRDYFENIPVKLIDFDYEKWENRYPYFIKGMSPSIFKIIKDYNIDLLVTAGSGYSEFPFNLIKNIPIILLNIFGSPNVQRNIIYNVCISNAVANKIRPIVREEKIKVMYILSEGPVLKSKAAGSGLRRNIGIKEGDIVFGRIGRADDAIFDPIGIRAFQKVVKDYPHVHYLIMSPPPILEKIVVDEQIPNVHFLSPSAKEEDIWAFHQAIDVLAHFRADGESCGLNIAEAMFCGKPIITHRSFIWNAHLEYLDNSFSRVAAIDNVEQYADYMREFIKLKKTGELAKMGKAAEERARRLFLINNLIGQFEEWVDEALSHSATL